MIVSAGDDTEHEGGDDEALDLDPAAAELFDEEDGEEVPGEVSGDGDDEVADGVALEDFELVRAGGVADFHQDDGLVEVGAVEGHVEEEPGGHGAEEDFEVAPFGEVDEEDVEAGAPALRVDLRPRGVDFLLQTPPVRKGKFEILVLARRRREAGIDGFRPFGRIEFLRFEIFLPLGHVQTGPESGEGGDEGDADLEAPDGV